MDNSKRPINQIIARINDAAKHGEALGANSRRSEDPLKGHW
ncbi:hypothetical protein [Acinetobacter baumannii]|nr:hypothetical protein [Acinetobacter baumannii]MDH2647729.1 hypothetical protein [Acinetobacter baumannii]